MPGLFRSNGNVAWERDFLEWNQIWYRLVEIIQYAEKQWKSFYINVGIVFFFFNCGTSWAGVCSRPYLTQRVKYSNLTPISTSKPRDSSLAEHLFIQQAKLLAIIAGDRLPPMWMCTRLYKNRFAFSTYHGMLWMQSKQRTGNRQSAHIDNKKTNMAHGEGKLDCKTPKSKTYKQQTLLERQQKKITHAWITHETVGMNSQLFKERCANHVTCFLKRGMLWII